jgi:alpha-glucan,water dikinase
MTAWHGVRQWLVWRRLIADEGFRKDLLRRIAETGVAIEDALGSAQDVEGCVEADGSITVVQTRPQM